MSTTINDDIGDPRSPEMRIRQNAQAAEEAVQQDLQTAEDALRKLLTELQDAQPRQVQSIIHRIQRQRVVIQVLGELAGSPNPTLHRELALLGRMQALDGQDDDAEEQNKRDETDAIGKLEARGISRESATRFARILSVVAGGPPSAESVTANTPVPELEPDPDFDTDDTDLSDPD